MGHLALRRAIPRAQARRYVKINAAEFAGAPKGQPGRPSKSLTLEQSAGLLRTGQCTRIGAHLALSLGTGIRTEEAPPPSGRTSTSATHPPLPRSPRASQSGGQYGQHGDTKTARSRRTIGLPAFATDALRHLANTEGVTLALCSPPATGANSTRPTSAASSPPPARHGKGGQAMDQIFPRTA